MISKINPENTKCDSLGIDYLDDFREPKLKLNDDKKIRM